MQSVFPDFAHRSIVRGTGSVSGNQAMRVALCDHKRLQYVRNWHPSCQHASRSADNGSVRS